MVKYNKLVRDNIPEILKEKKIKNSTRTLTDEEFPKYLYQKLVEEAIEFQNSGDIEELADIFEVVGYILDVNEWTYDQVYQVALDKAKERGAFDEKILLEWTD